MQAAAATAAAVNANRHHPQPQLLQPAVVASLYVASSQPAAPCTGISATRPASQRPDARERALWAAVILGIYNEVSLGGRGCQAYRDAMAALDGLEFVMGCLGYSAGAAKLLLERACRVHAGVRQVATAVTGGRA